MAPAAPIPADFDVEECRCAFLSSGDHDERPDVFEGHEVVVFHPTHGTVARARVLSIDRRPCHNSADFPQLLELESAALGTFAYALFDAFGNIRPEHVEHAYHRGSGLWGRELDDGIIWYVLDVDVNEHFQGFGVETFLMYELLRLSDPAEEAFFIACPESLGQTGIAQSLFSECGYRRIGRTDYLGFSTKLDHPTRSLHPALDAEAASANDPTLDEATERSRHGCTCGECARGWLSPRMRSRLCVGTQAYLYGLAHIHLLLEHVPAEQLGLNDFIGFAQIPPEVLLNASNEFYKGYCVVVGRIATILFHWHVSLDRLVAHATELASTDEDAVAFLAQDGRVVYVVAGILEFLVSRFDDIELHVASTKSVALMPVCKNDCDFALVARMLGVKEWEQFTLS